MQHMESISRSPRWDAVFALGNFGEPLQFFYFRSAQIERASKLVYKLICGRGFIVLQRRYQPLFVSNELSNGPLAQFESLAKLIEMFSERAQKNSRICVVLIKKDYSTGNDYSRKKLTNYLFYMVKIIIVESFPI